MTWPRISEVIEDVFTNITKQAVLEFDSHNLKAYVFSKKDYKALSKYAEQVANVDIIF